MTIADWLMIAAVLAGPAIAVRLTRYIDERREIRDRKLSIFKALMATRAYTVSWVHVEALNRIDLEFRRDRAAEREVLDAWKAYLDWLGNSHEPSDHWNTRRIDLLVELLHKMALVLKYDFDKTHIKNSSYAPRAHGDYDRQQEELRRMAIEVLEGTRAVGVTGLPKVGRQ